LDFEASNFHRSSRAFSVSGKPKIRNSSARLAAVSKPAPGKP